MKSLSIFFIIIFFQCILVFKVSSAKSRKANIAVADFENKTGNEESEKHIEFTSDVLLDLLIKTKRFNVISRKALRKILQEKGLDQSGVTDADDVQKLKQILHADSLIYGSILELSINRAKPKYIPAKIERVVLERDPETNKPTYWEDRVISKQRVIYPLVFLATISAKLVDVGTSEIISSETENGYIKIEVSSSKEVSNKIKEKEAFFKKALKKACISLIDKLVSSVPVFGKIIKIDNEKIIVDVGKETGLFRKSNLMVYVTEKIEGGRYKGRSKKISIEKEVAVLHVVEVHDTFSYAKLFSGELNSIKRGMQVKVIPPDLNSAPCYQVCWYLV